jgi:hypothetical protein
VEQAIPAFDPGQFHHPFRRPAGKRPSRSAMDARRMLSLLADEAEAQKVALVEAILARARGLGAGCEGRPDKLNVALQPA